MKNQFLFDLNQSSDEVIEALAEMLEGDDWNESIRFEVQEGRIYVELFSASGKSRGKTPFLSKILVPLQKFEVWGEVKQFEELKFAYFDGEEPRTETLDFEELEMMQRLEEKFRGKIKFNHYLANTGKLLKSYVDIFYDHLPSIKAFMTYGWNGKLFVAGDYVLGEAKNIVQHDSIKEQFSFPKAKDKKLDYIDFYLKKVLFLSRDPVVIRLMCNFSVLSTLTSVIDREIFKFEPVLVVDGITGGFKSSTCKVIFGHHKKYLKEVKIHFEQTTQAAMVEEASRFKDTVIVFDDQKPVKECTPMELLERKKKEETILRLFGDRTKRMKMEGRKTVDKTVKGLGVLVTEEFAVRNPSSIARTLIINIPDKTFFDKDVLKEIQNSDWVFPRFLREFIEDFALNYDERKKFMLKRFKKNLDELEKMNLELHNRFFIAIAWLVTIDEMIIDFMQMKNGINKVNQRISHEDYKSGVIRMIESQQRMVEGGLRQKEAEGIVETLKILKIAKKIDFVDISIASNNNDLIAMLETKSEYSGNFVGFKNSEYLYLIDSLVVAKLKTIHKEITTKDLRGLLDDLGLLVKDKSGARTVKVRIKNNVVRVLRVDKEKFENIVEGGN
jgi:hypothetical protein